MNTPLIINKRPLGGSGLKEIEKGSSGYDSEEEIKSEKEARTTITKQKIEIKPVNNGQKHTDIELCLRTIVDMQDARIFDLTYILSVLRCKYNKNYW